MPYDPAVLFTELTRRNALRRQTGLPLLDIRAEYDRAVQIAWRREFYDRHAARVRAELLADQRRKHGLEWGLSAGGRWWLDIMTRKVLEERFPGRKRDA